MLEPEPLVRELLAATMRLAPALFGGIRFDLEGGTLCGRLLRHARHRVAQRPPLVERHGQRILCVSRTTQRLISLRLQHLARRIGVLQRKAPLILGTFLV